MAPRRRGIPARTNNYERVAEARSLYARILRGLDAARPPPFIRQVVQRLPTLLVDNVRLQGVIEQQPIDLSLAGNHMTPTWARINRKNFEIYYRQNRFRLPVSAFPPDEARVHRWLFHIFRPAIAREMGHFSTERHIEMEVGIRAWRRIGYAGDPQLIIQNTGFDHLFHMVQQLGGRSQTIRVTCVFLIRADRANLGLPILYTKVVAPQPVKNDIETRVHVALVLLFRLCKQQNGVPTAMALAQAVPLLTVAQRNTHQNQPHVQIHIAIESLKLNLIQSCETQVIDRRNNRANYNILIQTYNNVILQNQ